MIRAGPADWWAQPARLGARVALVEYDLMGGDCLNAGCSPSKALLRSARAIAAIRDASRYGIAVPDGVRVDFVAVGGPSAIQAFRRCDEIYDVELRTFTTVETNPERVVFSRPEVCPECGGTGQSIGLAVVESCRRCAGSGMAASHS